MGWHHSFKTLQFQARHGGSKYFGHQATWRSLWRLSTNESPSLELQLAIIAACIPTLRPLFRFFDRNKPGSTYPPNRGFVKQGPTAEDSDFRTLNQASEAGPRYDLTSFEPSQSDSRSDRSTQQLRDADVIRKTVEINVLTSNRLEPARGTNWCLGLDEIWS